MWTNQGSWDASKNYVIEDIVLRNFTYYVALADNSNSEPPSANWFQVTSLDVLVYLIRTQLNLPEERVFIYNQNFILPKDGDFFVVIELLNSKNYSSTNRPDMVNLKDEIVVCFADSVRINILSKDRSARIKIPDIMAAFSSTFAIQWQEILQTKISQISRNIVDLSSVEGGSMLNRYAIDLVINSWIISTPVIEYYDNFSNDTIIK